MSAVVEGTKYMKLAPGLNSIAHSLDAAYHRLRLSLCIMLYYKQFSIFQRKWHKAVPGFHGRDPGSTL